MNLRRWLADVLTASRYCQSLESRLIEQRQDYTERMAEKDARIKELRVELQGLKLESDRMRLVLMPLGSPAGAIYADRFNRDQTPGKPELVPAFDAPTDWGSELQRLMQEEHDAVGAIEQRSDDHSGDA